MTLTQLVARARGERRAMTRTPLCSPYVEHATGEAGVVRWRQYQRASDTLARQATLREAAENSSRYAKLKG